MFVSILDENEDERPVVHRTHSQLVRLMAAKAGTLMDASDGQAGKGKKKAKSLKEFFNI